MHIVFYSKAGCTWCDEVREVLKSHHLAFEEKECRNNRENFEELVKESGQTLTPTLDIDGDILADSDAHAVSAYFHKKGIPGF